MVALAAYVLACLQTHRLWLLARAMAALDRGTHLRCQRCAAPAALLGGVFSVGLAPGPQALHVNPHGIVHDVLTVRTLLVAPPAAVIFVGRPQLRDTWFPGYTWTSAPRGGQGWFVWVGFFGC